MTTNRFSGEKKKRDENLKLNEHVHCLYEKVKIFVLRFVRRPSQSAGFVCRLMIMSKTWKNLDWTLLMCCLGTEKMHAILVINVYILISC